MKTVTQKLLHIIDTLNVGGAEKLLIGVVNGLPQFKHYVVYLSGEAKLAKDLPSNCAIVKLNYRSRLDIFRCIIQLRRLIRRESISTVHSHLFLSTLIARLACPASCRLITTLHSQPGKIRYKNSRLIEWLDKLFYRKRYDIIAVSDDVLHAYDQIIHFNGSCWVLPNYVEDKYYCQPYKKIDFDNKLHLVAVGALKKAKNYSYILEAFRFLSPRIDLDIYGAGELKEVLQQKIDKNNLPVHLCGERLDIHTVLQGYDAFIMGSLYEGNSLALLEAMASGLPVILSDILAFRTVTGDNAVYFDLHNPKELAQKLSSIAAKEINLEQAVEANLQKVKQVASKENYLRKLVAIYLNSKATVALSFGKVMEVAM